MRSAEAGNMNIGHPGATSLRTGVLLGRGCYLLPIGGEAMTAASPRATAFTFTVDNSQLELDISHATMSGQSVLLASSRSRRLPPMFNRMRKLTPEADGDGDSTMHSSPDLDAHDDEMFPDEALPATPRNPASFALDPTAELSPPNSQGPVNLPRGDGLTTTGASRVNANGKRPLSLNAQASGANELHHDAETGYSWSRQEDQPGFAWKNPRTKDEEHRALDQIVDKNSQIKSEDVLQIAYEDPTDTY
jgi:hypothetical protein